MSLPHARTEIPVSAATAKTATPARKPRGRPREERIRDGEVRQLQPLAEWLGNGEGNLLQDLAITGSALPIPLFYLPWHCTQCC